MKTNRGQNFLDTSPYVWRLVLIKFLALGMLVVRGNHAPMSRWFHMHANQIGDDGEICQDVSMQNFEMS